LLEHIYGRLNPRNNAPSGSILEFDQSEFVGGVNPKSIGLADRGYVYVPTACTTSTCHVHVVFHGCKQYAGKIGRAVVEHGGYNKWADTNKLIVLYPQTVPTDLGNPNGCWDWWGFNDPLPNSVLARKTSYQISAIKAMLDRLTGGFVAGGSSDTFGTPQHFSTPDSTSTSVALIWQPNSAAAGFNIYQSLGMAGPYTKRNSIPVKGASFVDRGLLASTTYYFEIRAVDASNNESAPTSPISKTTGSRPPACDPYFSDNVTHVNNARAYIAESGNARALGTNQLMGLLSPDHFSHLIKPGPLPFFSVDYCP